MKIRVELAKLGKSHAWLAGQIGVSRQYLHWALNNDKLDYVNKIAQVLYVEPKELTD